MIKSDILRAAEVTGSHDCKEVLSFTVIRNVIFVWLSGQHRDLKDFPYSLCSLSCDFLDGDSSFECCSIDPLTGSHFSCRRSPRLLTNGYYVWTEDSFLFDKDGNITLSPSQTSVLYKENLVR